MSRLDGNLHEYACHEGNHGMVGILAGARAIERMEARRVLLTMSRPQLLTRTEKPLKLELRAHRFFQGVLHARSVQYSHSVDLIHHKPVRKQL